MIIDQGNAKINSEVQSNADNKPGMLSRNSSNMTVFSKLNSHVKLRAYHTKNGPNNDEGEKN